MKTLLTATVATLILTMSAPSDSSYKCNNKFVHTGDSVGVVRAKCGHPLYKDETSASGSKILRETWTYQNKHGWGTALHFKSGKLRKIESLGRMN